MRPARYIVVATLSAALLAAGGAASAQRAPWSRPGDTVPRAFVIPIARAYDDASPPVPAPTGPLLGLITRYDDYEPGPDGALILPALYIARDARADRGIGPDGLLAFYRDYDGDETDARTDRLASGLPVARDYDDVAAAHANGLRVSVLPEITIEAVDRDAAPHALLPAVRVTP